MRTLTTLLGAASVATLGIAAPAYAQVTAKVVASCGSSSYTAGTANYQTQDTTGKICTSSTGSGGGAVTIADGADVTLGSKADAATCATTNTLIACLRALNATAGAAVPAGTNLIGKVGIDQTTPGTTNAVSATNLPATVSTGAGVTGASSPRETVAQDTTTIAGSAPGTAGTPSANVVTVQGATSMKALQVEGGVTTNSVTYAVATNALTVAAVPTLYNGTNYSRWNSIGVAIGGGAGAAQVGGVLNSSGGVYSPMTDIANPAANGVGTTAVHIATTSAALGATLDQECTVACASSIVSGLHNLYNLTFSATATGWLLLFDATSCPADGTVTPKRAFAYPTIGVTSFISWVDTPLNFGTGLAACFSTTGPYTKTASTTAFIGLGYR